MKTAFRLYPVILCGGSGTRLWPLSRRDLPKQFAVVREGKSLFERTYERASSYPPADGTVCVGHQDYRFLIKELTQNSGKKNILILEPAPRNTAPAIASAALYLAEAEPDSIIMCMPADHEIASTEFFHNTLTEAVHAAAAGWIAILGVTPSHAATSFGYIRPGKPIENAGSARKVDRFVEKPDEQTALQYVRDGYRWNSGMVVGRVDVIIDALARHVPDVLAACRTALSGATEEYGHISLEPDAFLACESISFDHAVLEKDDRVAVVDLDGEWSDVGNWTELAKLYPQDAQLNRSVGQAEMRSCEEVLVHSPERLTVALGLRNLVIVDTADALLVADRSKLDDLKGVVGELAAAGRVEVASHRRVARPWGSYEAIDRGGNYQVKRITVKPGGALSLQYHHHRAEHWVVVKGRARVTCAERQFDLNENESTYIPKGAVHRLENPGSEPLQLIEVQSGTYLGEDDIVRLEDSYGRLRQATPGR
jgi:mannose-1-phosphate guanylyltransferase/mannose-6-phosphate isomerase